MEPQEVTRMSNGSTITWIPTGEKLVSALNERMENLVADYIQSELDALEDEDAQ